MSLRTLVCKLNSSGGIVEGPSLVIATLEMRHLRGEPLTHVSGTSKTIPIKKLERAQLLEIKSWGKHLLLIFNSMIIRIHFLMFGSYRINDPKEDREPRLHLQFKKDAIDFYSCSIRELSQEDLDAYDWESDVMSDEWNAEKALAKVEKCKNEEVADVLMDQKIFAGVGNIIKNEILFRLKIHPEKKIKNLTAAEKVSLVEEARNYSEDFFEWKVLYILKRNWKIMRKKNCPDCEQKVERRKTGKLERWSYFCPHCQSKKTQLTIRPRALKGQ